MKKVLLLAMLLSMNMAMYGMSAHLKKLILAGVALFAVLPEHEIPRVADAEQLIPCVQGTTSSTLPLNHSSEENKWGWLQNMLTITAQAGSQAPTQSPTISHFSTPDIPNAEYFALVAELLTNP